MIGRPPWIKIPAGKLAKPGRSLTRSSKNLLGRLVMAEVRALPVATSAVIAEASSMRAKPSRNPPSSTIEIETAHLFLMASASQASRIFFTSVEVRHGLLRMMEPGVSMKNGRERSMLKRKADRNGEIELRLRHAVRERRQGLSALDHRRRLGIEFGVARALHDFMREHVTGAV